MPLPPLAEWIDGAEERFQQLAYVGAVYTIARFRRTTDDVLDEMARRARAEDRPQPQQLSAHADRAQIEHGETQDRSSGDYVLREQLRTHMHYDQYLAAGYPIGSGVAEGACRHLVKDRMELTGMRWERPGAQAMLHLRAIYLNGEWNNFVNFRIQNEQAKLYGPGTIYTQLGNYAQAA